MDELSVTTAKRLMQLEDTSQSLPSGPSSRTEETLWVDRYRPKRYTDLFGDECVHREVLAWVKQWDLCVFGMGNITYAILDGPVFRAQTKADPYPARMDDLSSAIIHLEPDNHCDRSTQP